MKRRKAKTFFHWKPRERDDIPVTFLSNPAIIYENLESIEPDHLYVPGASNQPAFDSFLKLGATLYVFQFPISETHDIKEFLSGQLDILPPKENWRFVFTTPPGCEVDVKATSTVKEFLNGVDVYLAHLDIEQQQQARSNVLATAVP